MRSYQKRTFKWLIILFFIIPFLVAFEPQGVKVDQKKIEREHNNKEKAARKEHQKAIRMHEKNQSKETRAMMKRSKKESQGNTPMRPPGGKRCK